jgi:hypothetical protein
MTWRELMRLLIPVYEEYEPSAMSVSAEIDLDAQRRLRDAFLMVQRKQDQLNARLDSLSREVEHIGGQD